MKKILITGATSFIGRSLIQRTLEEGWQVTAVVRDGKPCVLSSDVTVLHLDMTQYDQLGKLTGECDCFVHLAWNGTRGQARMEAELQRLNYDCSVQAVKSVLDSGCRRIISAGSQAEYGPYTVKIDEGMVCKPNTEYGKAKLAFYFEAIEQCGRYSVCFKEPRFFSLYGPGDFAGSMINTMLRNMLQGEACYLTVGTQKWDFLFIDDAVDVLYRLCDRTCQDGVYNFGSGDARELKSYVEEMAKLTRTKSKLRFGAIPYPHTGMVSLWPDVSKMRSELEWSPQITFGKGIRAILRSMRKG